MPVVKNFTHGAATFSDGAAPPASLQATFENGDFSISGIKEDQRETAAYESRGKLDSLVKSTRVYPTGSCTLKFTDGVTNGSGAVLDFLRRRTGSAYANNVSSIKKSGSTITGNVYTVDMQLDIEGTDLGDSADHGIQLEHVEVNSIDFAEGDPNTVTLNFTVYGDVVFF
ncbi:MAG: hypothetical protein AAFV53_03025 [Myxococcota bacterium]